MMWCVVVVCVVDVRVLSDEWIVRNWIDWIAFAEPVTHYLLYPVHSSTDNMPKDLLYPSAAEQKNCHKLKRLIQSPNSYFMDVKCPGCFHITTVFSNAQVTHFPSPQSPHSCLDIILLTWVYACSLICLQAFMLCGEVGFTHCDVIMLLAFVTPWLLLIDNSPIFMISVIQTVVLCTGCSMMLTQPTGGKCRLTEGCAYRRKVD